MHFMEKDAKVCLLSHLDKLLVLLKKSCFLITARVDKAGAGLQIDGMDMA